MSMPVALTVGDAAGIGPEIVVKLHAQGLSAPCVVYGDLGALQRAVQMLGVPLRCIAVETAQSVPLELHRAACMCALHFPRFQQTCPWDG